MGKKEESNPYGRPYNFMVPQDQNPNNPMLPQWSTNMHSYYNPGSTPTPFFSTFAPGPYLYHPYVWQNQANNALLHDALHDPVRLSNKPHVAEDAALAFSEVVQRNFGERNPDFNKLFSRNLQPLSLISGVSREYGNQSSLPKNDRDGASTSAASGSRKSSDENQDDTNDTNKDIPLSKKQKPDLITGDENPSGLTQNLEIVVKESDADADVDADADTQLKDTEGDDIRKERKRQSNRESAKRSRMKKQQECDELCKKIDTLKDENSVLTQRLVALSEDCLELSNENDSIQEELIKEYGRDAIADLLILMKAPPA